ncbi:hypothetical protein K7640_16700 [Micromonospora sp. PLK6-60]|uniref:hypothetical protein n=1 Tax=Micromonospora sp. PLK6-60 TaxID=2873383 RepID=UPI001CA7123D|nr:hypothetical protein [Micromonospora sp. PLK6-60]MBY8873476.1 hypothetical protein [Micromonospora sp. PLK6-60]
MPENYTDPSGNTEQFRAFVHAPDAAAAPAPSRLPLVIGGVATAVVLLAVAVWLALA